MAPPEGFGPSNDERALVDRARTGDHDAFRTLVEQHQDRVYRFVVRTLRVDRDTAADMAQDVFLRAFRGLRNFDGRCKFSTWILRIATNLGISAHRARRTEKRGTRTISIDAPIAGTDDVLVEPPSRELEPGERVHQTQFAAAVREAIQDLPDEFKHAVVLRDLQGLAYEEIGEILGVPPGTVRSRIHRGRLLLQDKLRDFLP